MTERPWIAHSVIVYLPMSENWIWTQIAGHSRYRPLVLTKRAENLDAFPLDGVGGEIVAAYSGPVARLLADRWRGKVGVGKGREGGWIPPRAPIRKKWSHRQKG